MPDGGFDFTYAHPFAELVQKQKEAGDSERLERLRYHLMSHDYFAFLATVFGMLEENLSDKSSDVASELEFVRSIRKDLIYLQREYRIDPAAIEA